MTAGEDQNYADVWRIERERKEERSKRLERAAYRIGVVFIAPIVIAGLLIPSLPSDSSARGGAALLWEVPAYSGAAALFMGYMLFIIGQIIGTAVEAVLSWRNDHPPPFSEISDLLATALSVGGLLGGAIAVAVYVLASA